MGVNAQMLIRLKNKKLSETDVKRLSYDLCESFGHDGFDIQKEDHDYRKKHHALEIINEYEQDGEGILPKNDEQLIEVHLKGRYWGPGYERGPLGEYIIYAEWFERRLPNCEILYGGDSSGVEAEPFDKNKRSEYLDHLAEEGNKPYKGALSTLDATETSAFCDFCEHPMVQYGFGQKYAAYSCHGCGDKIETEDDGKTWKKINQ